MFKRVPERKPWLSLFITASLLITGLLPPTTFAWDRDRKPIVVSFGQPNIWSLEQAHYLLARLHMTNLELQAKALSDSDLDPNIIHGTRIQILKQLLEISARYDQGVGFQNRRLVENARFNDSRRQEVITRRDANRTEAVALKREIARLEVERGRMNANPSATTEDKELKDLEIEKKRVELEAVKERISQDDEEVKTLSAEPSATPLSPEALPSPGKLPTSVLDKLVEKNVEELFKGTRDPKLNATTMLDNTVQLQYEIIAKQLTLLRDEVGPGERLVFLELPQSIYSTPSGGNEKLAQTWWHVNGYTRTDPLVRLLLELYEVEYKWLKIQTVPAFGAHQETLKKVNCETRERSADAILNVFIGLKCERDNARKAVLGKLYREGNTLFARIEQNGARNTSELIEAIRKVLEVQKRPAADDEEKKKKAGEGRYEIVAKAPGSEKLLSQSQDPTSQDATVELKRRNNIQKLKDELLKLLSNDPPFSSISDAETKLTDFGIKNGSEVEKAIEFISLDEQVPKSGEARDIQRRTIRAVDIIPRQSSLNVNDIQETVKATGILAAFKFLFGFAGQVNFQRQREQYEQFVHQELYASGFGKGSSDFGWTFGPLPGTKRVAPGVRTTFAALVVPNDAESIVMSARGCYFPRKKYQPLDFEDTGHKDWSDDDYSRRNCGDEQRYILAIPGGGETSNFWVTNVDYQAGQKGGEFVTVSVRGNNFSSQMGVLINGVPLFSAVGLAQPHLTPKKISAEGQSGATTTNDCAGVQSICGRYERIDSEQIVFSFKMPSDYAGTPTITLIAPGKSVDLNSISRLRINGDDSNLTKAAFMFGRRPSTVLSITDLQLLNVSPTSQTVKAILTGTDFDKTDTVYVNGVELTGAAKDLKSANLYELQFTLSGDEALKITIVRKTEAISKTFPNPRALRISNATVLSYVPPANNNAGIMNVKLEGSGFTSRLRPEVDGAVRWRLVNVSSREVIVRLVSPDPVVVIGLHDTQTGARAPGIVVQRP